MQMLPEPRRGWILPGRIRECAICFVSVFLLGLPSASAEMIYSKSPRFRIPFQFDRSELKRMNAKEFRLFVSQDSEQWERADTVPLTESKFSYEAPADGVYWFSVKTWTSNGTAFPAGPHVPSLQVCVDTVAPTIDLNLIEVEAGRVQLSWNAQDSNLQLDSLRLEYSEETTKSWRQVNTKNDRRGQTTWPVNGSGVVKVRAQIADLAGNITRANTEVRLAQPQAATQLASSERSSAVSPNASLVVAEESRLVPPLTAPPQLMSPPSTALPQPTVEVATPNSAPAPRAAMVFESSLLTSLPARVDVPRQAPTIDDAPQSITLFEGAASAPPAPRKLNSLLFRIGYSLQEVGPSGISQVDLYITEDGGRQWYHYGADQDRISPMEISVPHDGEFGFAFRVTNGLGRVDTPPQPGSAPEVTVVVDRVPPVARLAPVTFANQSDLNQVAITWMAQDRELAERPVALLYSTSPSGPWVPIGDWQANTGKQLWSVPSELNKPFFVRMDVRDAAGNMTRVIGDTPFLIDRSQPRAKVINVESLTSTQR